MIRHVLKLLWNRRRQSALLVLEVFASFLVALAVTTFALTLRENRRRPIGYSWRDVYAVEIDMKTTGDDAFTPEMATQARECLLALRGMDGVLAAAGTMDAPFTMGSRTDGFDQEGRYVQSEMDEVTDDLPKVLGIEVIRGRWFGASDDGSAATPIVINERLGSELFGSSDPVGQKVGDPGGDPRVVVGVVADYKKHGELSASGSFYFRRKLAGATDRPPRVLLVKVTPAIGGSFEQDVVSRLQKVAPAWSFEAQPLARLRETSQQLRMMPVVVLSTIAAFLMAMVGLGLFGVLWQNVTARTAEIGLRRAQGATAGSVALQILLEVVVLTAAGVGLGALLAMQLPVLGLTSSGLGIVETLGEVFGGATGTSFAGAIAVSALMLHALTAACALYPGWLASRIAPAAALRHD
ncbi:MAG: ABC transporter permease [Acidobacteriota bacterium]